MSEVTKQQKAFYRKLYLAHLIDQSEHSVPSLEEETGMPRRTIQDCLKTLQDIGIGYEFIPRPGGRNNEGHFKIVSWGPIRKEWIADRLADIRSVL